jgi:predicted Rossmann fold flavoprotein
MGNEKIAIIGGGAAGFFAALSVKQHFPQSDVTIFEKSGKVLSKVKVSGGGRCNVTHAQLDPKLMSTNYPRGEKFLRQAFSQFSVRDTIQWFSDRGVELKVEPDNRMFPESNSSQTIIDTFLREAQKDHINIRKNTGIEKITHRDNSFIVQLSTNEEVIVDKIIVAMGGVKSEEKLELFSKMGHRIEKPVPSLFTFNISESDIISLQGVVVPNAQVRIQKTKWQNQGPLLITHWGMSGPAILKLSSFAARDLAERNYEIHIQVNWLGAQNEDEVRALLQRYIAENGKKLVNKNPFDIPNRLWAYFVNRLSMDDGLSWNSVDKKTKNRIVNTLFNDVYFISKKTTFKEEFVICGGIALSEINPKTMQSRHVPGLYFAGEIMDIDGITGGFNFQAAWTTGFIAGKLQS